MDKNGQTWVRPLFFLSKYHIPLYENWGKNYLFQMTWTQLCRLFLTDSPIIAAIIKWHIYPQLQFPWAAFYRHNRARQEDATTPSVIWGIWYKTPALHRWITISRLMILNEFVGSALVRFERSTIPDHKGTRTVVLRFLKIITPVECVIPHYAGKIVQPEEGELHRRMRKAVPLVWSIDIDKDESVRARGLQLLWDAN